MKTRWVRQVGDGLVYAGKCIVYNINLWPNDASDWVDIYDGVDSVSGKLFLRMETAVVINREFRCDKGVHFDRGIYLDMTDSDDAVTVVFEPHP